MPRVGKGAPPSTQDLPTSWLLPLMHILRSFGVLGFHRAATYSHFPEPSAEGAVTLEIPPDVLNSVHLGHLRAPRTLWSAGIVRGEAEGS